MEFTNTIEGFNIITAKVVSKCYESFPVAKDFVIAEFADNESDSRTETVFIGTMEWLLRHRWIFMTSPKVIGPYYYGVQLTEKALKALDLLPVAVQNKQSIGTELMEAAKDGKWTAVPKLLLAMFQAAPT